MSHKTYKTINAKTTPQSEAIPGKDMVQNSAGGYSFEVDNWMKLQRFLILGTEGGSFYISENKLTRGNAVNIEKLIKENGRRVVDTIVTISDSGRAAKNDPAIFALAMCAGLGNEDTRKYALENLPKVCRIGTHLFHFADYVQQFRGWGHGLRKAIANWYTEKDASSLAFQLVKYQGRDGWTNKDLIKLSHPTTNDSAKNLALRWAIEKMGTKKVEYVDGSTSTTGAFAGRKHLTTDDKTKVRWELDNQIFIRELAEAEKTLPLIYAFEQMKKATNELEILSLVKEYRMPLEAIPTEKQTVAVLEQALPNLGLTALIRNLGRYTEKGIITPMSDNAKLIIEKLHDMDALRKARIHPLNVLAAIAIYGTGHGFKGSLSWNPISSILDALDEAFYLSFGLIEPTGLNWMLAIDVSGSMSNQQVSGLPFISCSMAAAAMAMIAARTEKNHLMMGFGSHFLTLDITPKMRLDQVLHKVSNLNFGGTDCSLPMQYATKNKLEVDVFEILTDNETWTGSEHPVQSLRKYRQASGRNAREIVVGMIANPFSIADPSDAGMLDIVGFDASAPQIMSDFALGKI